MKRFNRHNIYFWLKRKFRISEGSILPWWFILVKAILFPIDYIRYWRNMGSFFSYDMCSDTFTIMGIKYSAKIFHLWAKDGLPVGRKFEIIDRNEWGVITIKEMIGFKYIDKKDGTGGFMIPAEDANEEIIKELLKNPEYVLRNEGRS